MSSNQTSALVERYNELREQYRQVGEKIADLESHREKLGRLMRQCFGAAEVFGVDLSEHVILDLHHSPRGAGRLDPTIKDIVLEAVERAFPGAIRMAEIHRQLIELGYQIHPKTVGMNLHRWSKEGRVRCEGRDWFFVPHQSDTTWSRHADAPA